GMARVDKIREVPRGPVGDDDSLSNQLPDRGERPGWREHCDIFAADAHPELDFGVLTLGALFQPKSYPRFLRLSIGEGLHSLDAGAGKLSAERVAQQYERERLQD